MTCHMNGNNVRSLVALDDQRPEVRDNFLRGEHIVIILWLVREVTFESFELTWWTQEDASCTPISTREICLYFEQTNTQVLIFIDLWCCVGKY